MAIKNRVTEMLGVETPIVQAPMGWIARSQLASAVSNAGGMGIIETSSGELDVIKEEIKRMRTLTDKPFGVNIAQAFVRDPAIADFVIDLDTNMFDVMDVDDDEDEEMSGQEKVVPCLPAPSCLKMPPLTKSPIPWNLRLTPPRKA